METRPGGVAVTGCTAITGTPVADTASRPAASQARTSTPAAPIGEPVSTAVMKVIGASAPVTIRCRINGGPEQTETNVMLPWEKQYPVYNELESRVTADGGDTDLSCTIVMDGTSPTIARRARCDSPSPCITGAQSDPADLYAQQERW